MKNLISIFLILCSLFITTSLFAGKKEPAKKPVKTNVILMIPDGTSTSVLSLTRWYKQYCSRDKTSVRLAVDPHLRGLVKSHSSDAPIGDSAPTSSVYADGFYSKTGYVAMSSGPGDPRMYGSDDMKLMFPYKPYQPLATVLEAARLTGKKTGLVVTCQFPHATPADFSAHYYDRDNMKVIAKQMIHNGLDVVIAGGVKYMKDVWKEIDTSWFTREYHYVTNNLERYKSVVGEMSSTRKGLNESGKKRLFALFGEKDMPYDFDRNPSEVPSLASLLHDAVTVLNKDNDNGFFLMVEGSKVDWAAHANDVTGILSEFLAFDAAVDTATRFAMRDGNTVVIVCPDHGNGAPNIGNEHSNSFYDKMTLEQVFKPLSGLGKDHAKKRIGTAYGLSEAMTERFSTAETIDTVAIRELFRIYLPTVVLSEPEIMTLYNGCQSSVRNSSKDKGALVKPITEIVNSRTFFGFTTTGHTAEDVFLAICNPRPGTYTPHGLVSSDSINRYICSLLNLTNSAGNPLLPVFTDTLFTEYAVTGKQVSVLQFSKKDSCKIWNGKEFRESIPIQQVTESVSDLKIGDIFLNYKVNTNSILIPAFKNFYFFNGKKISLPAVTIWVDKADNGRGAFYLPRQVVSHLQP
jgi:alkaline phosphatase